MEFNMQKKLLLTIMIVSRPPRSQKSALEKKEFLNSKKEIVFAEYFQYSKPPTPKSEIKLIKLKTHSR
jgi:hypothetical protein